MSDTPCNLAVFTLWYAPEDGPAERCDDVIYADLHAARERGLALLRQCAADAAASNARDPDPDHPYTPPAVVVRRHRLGLPGSDVALMLEDGQ